jgi:hypothetical protein
MNQNTEIVSRNGMWASNFKKLKNLRHNDRIKGSSLTDFVQHDRRNLEEHVKV